MSVYEVVSSLPGDMVVWLYRNEGYSAVLAWRGPAGVLAGGNDPGALAWDWKVTGTEEKAFGINVYADV